LVLAETRDSPVFVWTQHAFEQDVLPAFLPDQRWFTDKTSRAIRAKVSLAIRFEHNKDDFGAVIVEAGGGQASSRYFLPLTIRWTRYTAIDKNPASVLSAVRRGSREGTLLDAAAEREFSGNGRQPGAKTRIPADHSFWRYAAAGGQERRGRRARTVQFKHGGGRQVHRENPAPHYRGRAPGNRDRAFSG
jgi:hypothetical protein